MIHNIITHPIQHFAACLELNPYPTNVENRVSS